MPRSWQLGLLACGDGALGRQHQLLLTFGLDTWFLARLISCMTDLVLSLIPVCRRRGVWG